VSELESAVSRDPRVVSVKQESPLLARAAYRFWRSMKLVGLHPNFGKVNGKPRGDRDYFVVMMGLDIVKTLPHFMFRGRKSVYVFDAWSSLYPQIKEFVGTFNIQYAFLPSSQTVEKLRDSVPGCAWFWIPEGVDVSQYKSFSSSKKDIDVLQFGRKYDAYHDLIVGPLERENIVYRYERVKGSVIFPTREEFVNGLARSKISICVPSSVTHPERSGDAETMTIRYLQSIVSRCLVLGRAPQEMIDLFGYNPVVEIDMNDPVGQIKQILRDYGQFASLIEKNYRAVVEHHTWNHRWSAMADVLFPVAS